MSSRKAIGGSFGAIVVLVIAQIIAQLLASIFVLIKLPEGICNIIAGIIYIGVAYILLKLFIEKLLKYKMIDFGIAKFSIKWKWFIIAVLLPVVVKLVYLLFFLENMSL